jgi:hypothetical protein
MGALPNSSTSVTKMYLSPLFTISLISHTFPNMFSEWKTETKTVHHPLYHNTSTLYEQNYTSNISTIFNPTTGVYYSSVTAESYVPHAQHPTFTYK